MVETVGERQPKELNQQLQQLEENYQHLQLKLLNNDKRLRQLYQVYQEKDHVSGAMERRVQELTSNEQLFAQLQQNLQEKEKMIQKLQEENQHLRRELDKVLQQPIQKQKVIQKGKLNFEMCGSRAPRRMHRGSATECGNRAYFRPGFTDDILSYNSDTKKWSNLLPVCPRDRFTLTVVKGFVTAVGGRQENKYTNTLLSLVGEGGRKTWEEHFPPMPTKRSYTAVACSGKALVVAGGEKEGDTVLTTVEVMDTDTLQWSTASSLPHPLTQSSATVCGDRAYVVGGRDKQGSLTESVFTRSLNILLQTKTLSLPGNHSEWEKIADLPVFTSTSATLNGQLLAVGGYDSRKKATNNIYSYNTETNSWEVISHMHAPRSWCLVTVLPENKLMVVGGEIDTESKGENRYENTIEIAKLQA